MAMARFMPQLVAMTTQLITGLIGLQAILNLRYLPNQVWSIVLGLDQASGLPLPQLGTVIIFVGVFVAMALMRMGIVQAPEL